MIPIAREADAVREANAAREDNAVQVADKTWQKALTTWQNLFTTQKNPSATQEAEGEVETMVSATKTLCDLATDCLRLAMHFFHPIQQCAQQIYHSALPLSPMSSQLRESCLQSVTDDQLSYLTAFSGAPETWGLLLRVIDVRPRQLTCITTFPQRIVAACGDVVNIYDAVTFVLRQSICTSEMAEKIHGSPHGSILVAAHSSSITMWDVQTGGLVHTFTVLSRINDTAVSTTGDHVACGLSDGSVVSWNTHTKQETRRFGNSRPVEAILWLSSTVLAVATQGSICVWDITDGNISNNLPTPGHAWGIVRLADAGEFLVGTSPDEEADSRMCTLILIKYTSGYLAWQRSSGQTLSGRPTCPTLVDNQIACITPPSGVRSFNIKSFNWTGNIPLLSAATSMAVSSNRNLVVQTNDSIQIFSVDVLKSDKVRKNVRSSRIYPLGENHIICVLESSGRVILLELETLRPLGPGNEPPPRWPSLTRLSNAQLIALAAIQTWQSNTEIPVWVEAVDEDAPLSALSPSCTRVVTAVHDSPKQELRVQYIKDGIILAKRLLQLGDLGVGEVYGLTFDSETRFHLKIDGPGWHVQIPCDIISSPPGPYPHTIIQGKPVPLSKPRIKPPYTLDANCEWVIDAESRKICWIPPGNVRRGNDGHFWTGLSLVTIGDDGVVRKLTFKGPDC